MQSEDKVIAFWSTRSQPTCLGTITVSFVLAAFSRWVSTVVSCECCADTSWRNCLSPVENQRECLFGSSRNGKGCIAPRVPQGWRGLSGFSETTRQVLSNDITFTGLKQLLCEKRVSYGIPIRKIWSRGLSCDRVQPPLVNSYISSFQLSWAWKSGYNGLTAQGLFKVTTCTKVISLHVHMLSYICTLYMYEGL